MALQYKFNALTGQFDLVEKGGGSGTTLTQETPVGTVDGSNTTFTVTHTPVFVVVDTRHLVNVDTITDLGGNGYTYSAGTIEVSADAPPLYFIRSYYAA